MTPQLQQAIKLLQLSRLELQQSVSQELLENPVLEELPPEAADEGSEAEGDAVPEGAQEKLPETVPEPEVTGELKSDLELGPQWDEYLNEMSDGRDYGNAEADDKELPSYDQTLTRLPSLSDHLMWQLRLSTSEPSLLKGGEWIIGNLDDDGYLRSTLEELAQQSGVPPPIWRMELIRASTRWG
jgi:RNA polymerase sigma-54 factor